MCAAEQCDKCLEVGGGFIGEHQCFQSDASTSRKLEDRMRELEEIKKDVQ